MGFNSLVLAEVDCWHTEHGYSRVPNCWQERNRRIVSVLTRVKLGLFEPTGIVGRDIGSEMCDLLVSKSTNALM